MFINKYPYTDIHELNLDWILGQMLQLRTDMKDFVNQNTIKYADPIQWNIITQYPANTVVVDPNTGNAYISSQPVPAGVALTDEDYWSVIGNFSQLYDSIKASIASADDGNNIYASEARETDSLLWLNNILYKVLSDISAGSLYITTGTGQNIEAVTIEDLLDENVEDIEEIIASIQNTVNQISDVIITPEMFGAAGDGVTDDTEALQECLNRGGYYGKYGATYLITDALHLSSDTKILGNFSTIKVKDGVDITFSGTPGNDPAAMFTIDNINNVSISNVIFDANGSSLPLFTDDTLYTNVCISLTGCSNITIKGCKFINLYTVGIRGNTIEDVTIDRNYFKHIYSEQGLRKECIYIINKDEGVLEISNNFIDEEVITRFYAAAGIYLANTTGAVIAGNTIYNCGRSGGGLLHPLESITLYQKCRDISIINNTIKSIGSAIRLDTSLNVDCSGNNIEFVGTEPPSSGLIRFAGSNTAYLSRYGDINISNNKLKDTTGNVTYMIAFTNESVPTKNINIESNMITGNNCIYFGNKIDNVLIKDNILNKGTSNARIDIAANCDNLEIDGNVIDDGYIRIRTQSTKAKNTKITNNIVAITTDTAAIMARDIENCIVSGNIVTGGTYTFNNSDMSKLLVHDNLAQDRVSGSTAYYGSNAIQHNNYYNGTLVATFS